jgi:glycosyltransferase involved in cell wall biosynthesis
MLSDINSAHIQKWAIALSQKGIEIGIYSISKPTANWYSKYNIQLLNSSNISASTLNSNLFLKLNYLKLLPALKKAINDFKPDIVHAHYATSYGLLAAFSGFHPMIITGWGADIFDSPKNYFIKKLLLVSLKRADAITVLSEITKKEIIKYTNKNVQLIPFGVDLEKFPSRKPNADNIIRIGTIRTLSEKYGIEYLIRAFAQLAKKYKNIQLEIVGDGPLRTFLENLTIELGVEKRVTFHGYVNQNTEYEKYISLLTNFDIFAILSIIDSETFGVAAVEASACEIPIVATSVGGLPEVIESEKTGILVPPKNVEETSKAVERLIIDKELRILMGKNGRKRVEENYNWKNNIIQMLDLYEKLLNKKNITKN